MKTKKILILILGLAIISSHLFSIGSFIEKNNLLLTNEKYISDDDGNILIFVNVWGHVKNPGRHLIYDGMNLPTLIAYVGGILPGSNIKKIKIIRDKTDKNGKNVYEVNLSEYYKTGITSNLVKVLPNDTIIIEQNLVHRVFNRTNVLPSLLQLLNIYLQITLLSGNS